MKSNRAAETEPNVRSLARREGAMDNTTTIRELLEEALRFRDARNWKQFHDAKNLAMGLAIEAAEVQELFLWKNSREVDALVESPQGRARLGEELADCCVFLLYLTDACGIDLSEAVRAKLVQNEHKYPVDKAYNRHTKYTELKEH
jgi:NTP pyrophosphatase (non-canonical NTP hydrolase)